MNILGIKEVYDRENGKEIFLTTNFKSDIAVKWELSDPLVSVIYSKQDDDEICYMEVIDRGVKVHGFEISEEEENKVLNFLKKKNII